MQQELWSLNIKAIGMTAVLCPEHWWHSTVDGVICGNEDYGDVTEVFFTPSPERRERALSWGHGRHLSQSSWCSVSCIGWPHVCYLFSSVLGSSDSNRSCLWLTQSTITQHRECDSVWCIANFWDGSCLRSWYSAGAGSQATYLAEFLDSSPCGL